MKKYQKTSTVIQREPVECAAACLTMIFAYFGKNVPLEQMCIETEGSRTFCSAADILRVAKNNGLDCHGFRKKPDELRYLKKPCVIHWNFNHFVVFEGFKGKYAFLNDPAVGRRRLTDEELSEGFTGIVLTFEKTDKFIPDKKDFSLPLRIKNNWKNCFQSKNKEI